MTRFEDDRALMLTLLVGDAPVGGVIAYRKEGAVLVRAIGVDAAWRGRGLARRLMETVEVEAMTLGCRAIVLGSAEDARGFYDRLGYRGKRTLRQKDLPIPGPLTNLRLQMMRAAAGDMETGVK